jgi:hypothetical protein
MNYPTYPLTFHPVYDSTSNAAIYPVFRVFLVFQW